MSMELAPEEIAECPSCHGNVALDAKVCPSCGETFADELAIGPSAPAQADSKGRVNGKSKRTGTRRTKLLFYLGIFLMLLGGPGIAIGSWLHDVLQIKFLNYNAFDVFGPMNRLVVAVGLMVTVVGIVLFILSLRLARPSAEEREIREFRET
jgi:hypothetical protein